MRHLVEKAGVGGAISVDSAGTAAYHAGESPDRRTRAAARRRGIEMTGRARQFKPSDWQAFDYVVAMDAENLRNLRAIAPDDGALAKLHLLRSFDPQAPPNAPVPDPYYGGDEGFDEVLDLCEAACSGLLARVRREQGL